MSGSGDGKRRLPVLQADESEEGRPPRQWVAIGSGSTSMATIFGFIALVMATINVVGGFLVTNRMLEMFRRKK